jgi:tRNA A37 methylthiotransferase MiaB
VQIGIAGRPAAPPVTTEELPRTQLVGRTRGDQVVVFDGEPSLKGQLVNARITSARGMTLFADLVPHTAPV